MNNSRLEARLLAYSIDVATLAAGRPRRKRSNADVWLVCAVLLAITGVVVAL